MARPQKENGFTGVAHEILEEVSSRKFNATQLSILLIVWRMTYGFNRKDHELAVNFFVKHTGFSKRNIQEALHTLLESDVLKETQKATFNQTRKLAFNKNYDEWLITSRAEGKQVMNSSPDEQKVTSTGDESNTSTGDESFTHERKKENIKENKVQSLLTEIELKEKPTNKAGVIVKFLNEKFPDRFKRYGPKGNIKANDVFKNYIEQGHSVIRLIEVIEDLEEDTTPWDITEKAKAPVISKEKKDQLEKEKRKADLSDLYDLGLDAYVGLNYGSAEDYWALEKELELLG